MTHIEARKSRQQGQSLKGLRGQRQWTKQNTVKKETMLTINEMTALSQQTENISKSIEIH